jgi:hypothetical protein
MLTVTDAPDSAYDLCSKYAPDCGSYIPYLSSYSVRGQYDSSRDSSRSESRHESSSGSKSESSSSGKSRSKDSRKKSSSKNKTKSSIKKSKKAADINTRNFQTLRSDNEGYVMRDNSDDLENLGFNGEDDYYDSLNSGNEDGIFGTSRPDLEPVTEVVPSYIGFDDDVRGSNNEDEIVR